MEFLKERGLELSQEKTVITHIDNGFDFLGWNFRKFGKQNKKVLHVRPSRKSVQSLKDSIKESVLIHGKAKSQDELIRELNPKIRGWCNYHRSVMSSRTFANLDSFIFQTLFRWAMRKHNDKGKKWIANRYWHPIGRRKWVFCTNDNQLTSAKDVKSKRHVKIRNKTNPYIDTAYYLDRQKNRKYERGYRDKGFAM